MMPNVRKDKRKPLIAIIGDAVLPLGSIHADLAERLGTLLVDAGYRVLTGGLDGVMEAACRGAHASAAYQSGDTVGILPGNDPAAANPFVDVIIPTGLDLVRNTIVAQADAVIAVGGGAGTLAEVAYAWMLKRLIITFRVDGWSGQLADTRLDPRIRYPELPEDVIFGVDEPEAAMTILHEQLSSYTKRHRGVRRRD